MSLVIWYRYAAQNDAGSTSSSNCTSREHRSNMVSLDGIIYRKVGLGRLSCPVRSIVGAPLAACLTAAHNVR